MKTGRTRAALLGRIERLESRAAAFRPMRVRFVGKPPVNLLMNRGLKRTRVSVNDSLTLQKSVKFKRQKAKGINCASLRPTAHLEFERAASRTLSVPRGEGSSSDLSEIILSDSRFTNSRRRYDDRHGALPSSGQTAGANLIGKVENGVDQFRNYLKRRGDNAPANAPAAQSDQQEQARRSRRGDATESRKATVKTKKDELDDSLDAMNRSTNRLRRKFDATDTWIETKVQVQQVLDDARRINQAVARGKYGTEVARLWAALRTGVNDLARAYGLQPLAV